MATIAAAQNFINSRLDFIRMDTAFPATNANSSQKKTVLMNCTEDLSPNKVTSLNSQSTLWKVAARVSVVAFIALAVACFVAISLSFPAYGPMAGLAAFILAMPGIALTQSLYSYSDNSKSLAIKYDNIQKFATNFRNCINGYSNSDLNGRLTKDRIEPLIPILAQAQYYERASQAYSESKTKYTNDAKQLATDNFNENRAEISSSRKVAISRGESALEAKVQSAFFTAALSRPHFQGTLEDIVSFTRIPLDDRIVGEALGERTGVDVFLKFKDGTSLTFDAVTAMSINAIAQRILGAMHPNAHDRGAN